MENKELAHIFAGLDDCIGQYCKERRERIGRFVEENFSIKETFEIQKKFWVSDLFIYPLNALWAIPNLVIKKVLKTLEKIGWTNLQTLYERIPSGIKTNYQRVMEDKIRRELLEWTPPTNALIEKFKVSPSLFKQVDSGVLSAQEIERSRELSVEIEHYTHGQVLITDLTSSFSALFIGWLFFGDQTLGMFGLGDQIAKRLAWKNASSHFFLGKTVGSTFYHIFPPQPSTFQVILGLGIVTFMLTVLSLTASLIADPLRKVLGLHHRKLNQLIDNLEEKLFIQLKKKIKTSAMESSR